MCRLVLLDREKLLPGETGLVQLVLESPTVALPKDRFIIRTFSPTRTVGGGTILDPNPRKHKRFDAQMLDGLKKLEGSLTDVVEQMSVEREFDPQSVSDLAIRIGARENDVGNVVEELCDSGKLVKIAGGMSGGARTLPAERYLHAKAYDELTAKLIGFMDDYFARHPYKLLMPVADLQSQFLRITDRQTFETLIDDLCTKNRVYRKDSRIGLVGREIGLKPGERELADRIEEVFRAAGLAPPLEDDVRKEIGTSSEAFKNIMSSLIERERLVRLSEKVTYHREFVQAAMEIVAEHIKKNESITVAELRDRLGVSRKYALALLEHFDNMGFTKREGDKHIMK